MSELLLHRFEACAAALPEAEAVRCGTEIISYAELNRRANLLAHALLETGLKPEELIGLCLQPSVEMLVGMLGILKAGGAWVPLDPQSDTQRLKDVTQSAGLSLVLIAEGPLPTINVECMSVSQLMDSRQGGDIANPETSLQPDGLCYVMFTSGSTGTPNGVMVTHANIAGLFDGLQTELGFSSTDRWSALHAYTFGFSVWETWGALSTGGCLVIVPDELRKDPQRWFQHSLQQQVSILSITPSGFRQLLAADCLPAEFSNLRLVVFSGEAVNDTDVAAWFERYADSGPRLINTYALTETAGRITWLEYLPDAAAATGSIGRPVSDAVVRICEPEGRELATGETGELFIGGPMLARGYLSDPALTAERFVNLIAADGSSARFYKTGDRAVKTATDEIVFIGRDDAQVKLRGHRIELGDIEHTLRHYPGVRDAAVVVQEQGAAPQLTAFVVPEQHERSAESSSDAELEFWPSLGEYQIYDDLLYDFMSADEVRVASYKRAFQRHAKDKVVLDIGTGKDAILARLAAAAGARKVYAVEVLEDACTSARQLVKQLGLEDRIEVLHGDMQSVAIPDVIDVSTQGIIGNIGSSDGIAPIWNSARHLFAENFTPVPATCTTLIAPAQLVAAELASFTPLAAQYTREIFSRTGAEFDVRLCVRNFPTENLLAEAAVFEQLDFHGELGADYQGSAEFEVTRDGCFDGFLLWTNIQTDEHESVDFLQHQQAWLPVWFPLTDESVGLQKGDRISARWRCTTPAGQVFPDYEISVQIQAGELSLAELHYQTRHYETAVGETALHRQLLASLTDVDDVQADLASWLTTQLPAHMQPTRWVSLPELPLNNSGKLDRLKLREQQVDGTDREAPVQEQTQSAEASGDPLLVAIANIWRGVLGLQQLTLDEDFFDVGGDSILAVRLTTEVQRYLDDAVFLAALFDAPTISSYTRWLREHHAAAVAHRLSQVSADSIEPVSRITAGPRDASHFGLSSAQQSLLFLQQLYPENTGANEQFIIRVKGGADADRLRRAWHALLQRHDVLRAEFNSGDAQIAPWQNSVPVEVCIERDPMPEMSLLHLSVAEAASKFSADAKAAIAEIFNLQVAPLLRTCIYVLPTVAGEQELTLLVTAHHIIADGMCVQLISDELADLYALCSDMDFAINTEPEMPELQYADFVRWQIATQKDQSRESDVAWWLQNLEGHSGQPASLAQTSSVVQGSEARFGFEIPAELADRIRHIARDAGATPFMLLLAVWRIWLARCLLEKDLLLGSPVTLRKDESTAHMLGCMVNNVVFRNVLDMREAFTAVLKAERDAALAAVEHSDVPFEKLVEVIQPERHLGRHPLFQLMFLFEDRSSPPALVNDLSFEPDVLPVDRASYWDLELSVTDRGVGKAMQAFIGVRRDVYDADALSWWPEGLLSMLQAIAENPARIIAELPLLSSTQRQRVLVEWNDTQFDTGTEVTLDGLVRAQAGRTPDSIAVVDAVEQLSYADLLARADEYARALVVHEVKQGDLVGLCVVRSGDTVALQLAILKCGAAWLPLDPGYPIERLKLMLADAQPQLVVQHQDGPLKNILQLITVEDLRATELPDVDTSLPASAGSDAAYVLYTSGSTGVPKGVVATHGSAVSRCRWMWQEYGFSAGDVFGQRTSLNFVDSVWEIFGALAHGAVVNVLPAAVEQNPVAIVHWLQTQKITHTALVPSLLRALLDVIEEQGESPELHSLISSGESLSLEMARRVHRLIPGCRLLNTYGTSETWDVSCHEVLPGQLETTVPIGKPVANAALCILDETMQPVPPGVEGELFAGGAGLVREYLGKPELTAQQFIANPLIELATHRLYRTGDRARFRADGTVDLLGRQDRQIKLRGIRIEAGDIEAQVEARADVAECAVVLRNAPGEDDWLALYIECSNKESSDEWPVEEEVRRYLYARLPRSMVPAEIWLLDTLPRTPSGKLDIAALPVKGRGQSSYAAPRNELESSLAEIWAETLGLERVGIQEDFFALHGHSLLATRMIARIGETLQLDIPLQCLFEAPTVAGLARSIEALRWATQGGPQNDSQGREVIRL